jgi:hypothetical protein
MTVLQVERKSQQSLAAVQMSMDNAGQILELLAKVAQPFSDDLPGVMYGTQSQTGSAFADQGGWRITFSRADHPDQFAYQGDWILVTDATYDDGWTLAPTSEVFVYGISSGLAGTAGDFDNTFAPVGGS